MKNLLLLFICLLSTVWTVNSQAEFLSNGSFETGDLTGWMVSVVNNVDGGPTSCTENWRVQENSTDVCVLVPEITPTDGISAAFTSFDSDMENTEWILEQTVTLPLMISAANISFDFKAEFDLSFGPPTIGRELTVALFDTGGNLIGNVFNDQFLSNGDLSIDYSQDVDVQDLLGGLEGTDVVLRITAIIPEPITGPSKALIDNVSFLIDATVSVIDNNLSVQSDIFPNPTSGNFTLNYEGIEPLLDLKIFDMNGRLVHLDDLSKMRNEMLISTSLRSGIYILEITSTSNKAIKKLIVR
jgi:hypothetical protein